MRASDKALTFQDNHAPSMEAVSGGNCGGSEAPQRRGAVEPSVRVGVSAKGGGAGAGRVRRGVGGPFEPTLAAVVRHKVCKGAKKERAAKNSRSDIEPDSHLEPDIRHKLFKK
jgi:hypothetical protein